ncbi:flagellar hook-basal body protein [Peribacillus sp. SCS-155]|uniref:flagellar hook-basal body protein n=1 Tax=Peribacillus sedimenti TaxID=3115297 RepID=UPI00390580FB
MLRGFYTAASGMYAQQRRTEMLTNNMSNANTPGYKADQSSMRAFPEMLIRRMGETTVPTEKGLNLPVNAAIGSLNTGVYMQEAAPNFLQGSLQQTQRKTDIALLDTNMPVAADGNKGTVFFTVLNGAGETRYTRNGNFTIDQQGYLTTPDGYYVLDDNSNRIQLQSENFNVNEEGYISENGIQIARLGAAFAANPYTLVKEGDGLLRQTGQPLESAFNNPAAGFQFQQGAIEASNVDISKTMTDMTAAYRSFEANQKILQAYDRSMEKAVNEVGKLG